MKKIYFLVILLVSLSTSVSAKRSIERIYISTDKTAYVSGEAVWLSAFCLDIADGKKVLTDLSSIAYLELHSSSGVVLTSKIALFNGRGSGRLEIPEGTPTGNYKLISYTKQMLNERNIPFFEKTISVYNTLSSDRTKESNVITPDSLRLMEGIKWPSQNIDFDGKVLRTDFSSSATFKKGESISFKLANSSEKPLTMRVSIAKSDALPVYDNTDIKNYINDRIKPSSLEIGYKYLPEYEGEIIKGKITKSGGTNSDFKFTTAFLSVPKGDAEIFTSEPDSSGVVTFFTNNIYGNREVIFEVRSSDTLSALSLELFDPFVKPKLTPLPALYITPDMEGILKDRSIGMQIGKRFGTDTLFEKITPKYNPLLSNKKKEYLLDDYTRFPVMEEVIIEYVTELRYRKSSNSADLQVRWENAFNSLAYSKDNTLAIIDGIPVFDHRKILGYDPLKIKSLTIYGGIYYIGNVSYTGIVSLKSYKGDYPGLTFNKNVRIMDFKGVQYPSRFTGKIISGRNNLPDYRNTLYWDPIVNIGKGEEVSVNFSTPAYPGKFVLSVEGVDSEGLPFVFSKEFVVE